MIIDGNKIAAKIIDELREKPVPKTELSAILVGKDRASLSFLAQKERVAKYLGVNFRLYQLSEDLTQKQLINEIHRLSSSKNIGGLLIQLPLPQKYDRIEVLNAIGIEKDVDVLNGHTTKILAPASGSLKAILEFIGYSIKGKQAVIIGPGFLIGKPIAKWLMGQVAKLTIIDKGGPINELETADLVVSGVGNPNMIHGENLKIGAVVIDYGYGKVDNKLTGDINFETAVDVASYITPTPGGTGPVVVAQLLSNFYKIAK